MFFSGIEHGVRNKPNVIIILGKLLAAYGIACVDSEFCLNGATCMQYVNGTTQCM